MASETISTPQMIVPYEWILENVEEEPMTIASKMILFRGEKVFRVGLKNHAPNPVLFLMAIDLGKIGMKVKDVKYGIQGSGIGPENMATMTQENIGDNGNLQLFTIDLDKMVTGQRTFVFRICVVGAYPGYSYQLSDRLAKDQIWAAVKDQRNLADVELIVKDKTFRVHKAILAARSKVFADKFENKQPGKDVHNQIRIEGVKPSTVENFLHFIYTGESIGTLADEDLLKLADRYQLTTLTGLCRVALKEMDAIQMAKVRKRLNNNAEELSSDSISMPEKETEIFFDRTTPTFCCTLTISANEQPKCVMQYQNENICIAYLTGKVECSRYYYINKPVINLSCAKHRRFGLQVEDVYCSLKHFRYNEWFKLEAKNCQKSAELLHFAAQTQSRIDFGHLKFFNFDVKFISTIGNYYYEMMDDGWLTDFWVAATNEKLTDVEIFIGTVKVMEAHRVILCARSPVLNESLRKISNTAGKPIVTFGSEFDVEIIKNFLNFLYTGSLKTTEGAKQLSKLAKMYQVETLKNVCQLNVSDSSPDVEELTNNCLI
ncbi:uncharacterized protein LOC124205516 [Daphnia pulex]|uniref:uncharacterized protein LOC124205516 n=1 Tax=Daphnia pulex TaxID=6669 RepID=UPI001EDE9950|nr:uncharacterized protein LOC124205516 [Daphnia pulex]